MTAPVKERPHGYTRYKMDRCRCYVCCFAVSEYRLRIERETRKGTWQPYVDAEPARQHVKALMAAGIGRRRVAELAGVTESCIVKLIWGQRGNPPSVRLRPANAAAILAIPVMDSSKAPGMTVDATGTRRRIAALGAFGWSLTLQAAEIGWTVNNLHWLLHQDLVQRTTAEAMRGLYDKWSMTPPPASYARTRVLLAARKNHWFQPLAWDDDSIDDPAAFPVLLPPPVDEGPHVEELMVQHLMAGHSVDASNEARLETARRLSALGWSSVQIAPVVGRSRDWVRTSLRAAR